MKTKQLRPGQTITIGPNIRVRLIGAGSGNSKLAIEAPANVSIHREEIFKKVGPTRLHKESRVLCRNCGGLYGNFQEVSCCSSPFPEEKK